MSDLYAQLALQIALPIALGWMLRHFDLLPDAQIARITQFAFWVLAPMLFFRSMARVDASDLRFAPVAAYFTAAACVITWVLWRQGLNRRSGVVALAATYSNNVMIGLPLVSLLMAREGITTMLTLLVFHSLVLLTAATLMLELSLAREQHAQPALARIAAKAAIKTVMHPVPLPIAAGLAFGVSGGVLPPAVDAAFQWAGWAFAPLALGLVGASLIAKPATDTTNVHNESPSSREVWQLVAAKNVAMPVIVALLCWASGQRGEGVATMVLAAALPIGANVMLFAHRYQTAQTLAARAITLSSTAAVPAVALVVWFWR